MQIVQTPKGPELHDDKGNVIIDWNRTNRIKDRAKKRELRATRRKNKRCVRCDGVLDDWAFANCLTCRLAKRESEAKRKDRKRELDRLKPKTPETRESQRVYSAKRYRRMKREGKCVNCGKPKDIEGVRCLACVRKYNAVRSKT